jgi:hypothetical protein
MLWPPGSRFINLTASAQLDFETSALSSFTLLIQAVDIGGLIGMFRHSLRIDLRISASNTCCVHSRFPLVGPPCGPFLVIFQDIV